MSFSSYRMGAFNVPRKFGGGVALGFFAIRWYVIYVEGILGPYIYRPPVYGMVFVSAFTMFVVAELLLSSRYDAVEHVAGKMFERPASGPALGIAVLVLVGLTLFVLSETIGLLTETGPWSGEFLVDATLTAVVGLIAVILNAVLAAAGIYAFLAVFAAAMYGYLAVGLSVVRSEHRPVVVLFVALLAGVVALHPFVSLAFEFVLVAAILGGFLVNR